jgi:Type VII secretion system ESX-1, transport TM domain B
MPDGLAAISEVQANLLLAQPAIAAVQGRPGAIELPPDSYTGAPAAASLIPPAGELAPPLAMPAVARTSTMDGRVCAATADAVTSPVVTLDVPAPTTPSATAAAGTGGRVDQVVVPPGRGAVVESMAAPTAPDGTLGLVTDLGVWYSVPRAGLLGPLGYPRAVPVRVPAALVALVPAGPALDPDAARVPVAPGH